MVFAVRGAAMIYISADLFISRRDARGNQGRMPAFCEGFQFPTLLQMDLFGALNRQKGLMVARSRLIFFPRRLVAPRSCAPPPAPFRAWSIASLKELLAKDLSQLASPRSATVLGSQRRRNGRERAFIFLTVL